MSNLLEKASILLTPTAYDDGKILSVKPSIVLGEELIVNGDFHSNVNNWTAISNAVLSWNDGTLKISNVTQGYGKATQSFTTILGKTYKLSFDGFVSTAAKFQYRIGTTQSGSNIAIVDSSSSQNISVTFVAQSTTTHLAFVVEDANTGVHINIDNVSVKEDLSGDFDFTRNSSATRVNSQGLIEDMQILGEDLVQNGNFSELGSELIPDGNFTNQAAVDYWQIASTGGVERATKSLENGFMRLTYDTASGGGAALYKNSLVQSGKSYKVTFRAKGTANSSFSSIGDNSNIPSNPQYVVSNPTLTNDWQDYEFYVPVSSATLRIYLASAQIGDTLDITNISVKEVGQDWTLFNASIVEGKLVCDNVLANTTIATQLGVVPTQKQVKLQYDVIVNSGAFRILLGSGGTSTVVTTSGTYTFYETSGTGNALNLQARSGGFDGSIDNISVIEITDDTNLPRIDYSPYSGAGTCGHWLFEPQSTNSITYSEDFANAAWTKTGNTVVTSNTVISPNGTLNGSTVSGLSGTGTNDLRFVKSENTANNTYTYSVYLKGSGTVRIQLSNGIDQGFDDTVTLTSSWKRHFLTSTFNSTTTTTLTANLDDLNGQTATQFDIWGAQLEQNSYATSYIPTSGSAVTRNQEAAFGSGNSSLINSTEGVLYAEVATLADDGTSRYISLSDGTQESAVAIWFSPTSNQILVFVKNSGTFTSVMLTTSYNTINFNKIAISYKVNNFSFWVNGVKVATDTSGNTFSSNTLTELAFDDGGGGNDFYGKTKCLAVFKEALTDDELECLTTDETSFSSFNALALANNYTII